VSSFQVSVASHRNVLDRAHHCPRDRIRRGHA
jgi:hypothetical protein